mmetsp:Transcript_62118/g.134868  ORF Transcript_62118/g.134868 Transcript_62118/m.134868 type:complete len:151 (+) Transcript_62118:887-1339(+)
MSRKENQLGAFKIDPGQLLFWELCRVGRQADAATRHYRSGSYSRRLQSQGLQTTSWILTLSELHGLVRLSFTFCQSLTSSCVSLDTAAGVRGLKKGSYLQGSGLKESGRPAMLYACCPRKTATLRSEWLFDGSLPHLALSVPQHASCIRP